MGYWNKVIRRIIELGFAVLLFCIALKLSIFYIPFIIALAIAMTIEPIIKWVSKKTNLERKKSAIIVLIIAFMLILAILAFSITTLISEASNLLLRINDYIDIVYLKIEDFTGHFNIIH